MTGINDISDTVYPCIVAIGFNRVECFERLLKSIEKAIYPKEKITLVISIDYWKDDNPCYEIADAFEWHYGQKKIIKHKENLGLRNHILSCGDLSGKYGAVIILEDDLVVSPAFYLYTLQACNFYKNHEEVVGIGLFSHRYNGYAQLPFMPYQNGYDTYYEKWVITWGECFCAAQWREFRQWYSAHFGELEYKNSIPHDITDWPDSSWSKYMVYYLDETEKYYVSPYVSYTTNYAEAGTHVKQGHNTLWQNPMQYGLRREMVFSDLNNSVKYDLFFERIDISEIVKPMDLETDPIMDLYGLRDINVGGNCCYCFSTQNLPYHRIKEFDLRIRPIEMNINLDNEGKGIILYDLSRTEEIQNKKDDFEKMEYYLPLLRVKYKVIFMYCLKRIISRITAKILRRD